MEELTKALELYTALGDRSGVSIAIGNMGNVCSRRGEYERALESLHKAAEEHRSIGYREGLAEWLQGIADVLLEILVNAHEMPEYLPTHLPHAREETWRAMSLEGARERAEECVAISEELHKPFTFFSTHVLLARVDVASRRLASCCPMQTTTSGVRRQTTGSGCRRSHTTTAVARRRCACTRNRMRRRRGMSIGGRSTRCGHLGKTLCRQAKNP